MSAFISSKVMLICIMRLNMMMQIMVAYIYVFATFCLMLESAIMTADRLLILCGGGCTTAMSVFPSSLSIQVVCLVASGAAIYSASALDRASTFCFFEAQEKGVWLMQ